MDRREFISGTTALLGGIATASPVKSIIGASNTRLVKENEIIKPSPYDYVQNGLVALYDGEYNDIDDNREMYHNTTASK